jgi:hypothetical protein
MDEKELAQEEGLSIIELERSEGWTILSKRIREEMDALVIEQRGIELSGRQLQEIATDYIRITQKLNGLARVFEIVEEIKERKRNTES